jgi:phospholipase A-2-activating protein
LLDVRSLNSTPDDDPDAYLPAHESNVCALHVSPDGSYFVSGSWDTTACVWQVGKWDEGVRLDGHSAAVWGVLAYDKDTIITGMSDMFLFADDCD